MTRLYQIAVRSRALPAWARYGAAALLVGAGLAARLMLIGPGPGYPYVAFALPLMLSAVFLGRGPGAMVVFSAAALALWLFVPPAGVPRVEDPRDLAAAAAFTVGALTLVLLAEAAFRAVAALRSVLEGIGEPFYALHANGRVLHASRAALEMWGRPSKEVIGRRLSDVLPEAEGSAPLAALENAMRTRRPVRLETASKLAGRWVEVDIHPAPHGGLSVSFRDIHERRLAHERQALLVGELTHRIKNTLALVLAISDQTRRSVSSPEAFHTLFRDRLAALARVHDALRRSEGAETSLETVAREALAPFDADAARLMVAGPKVKLASGTAIALGMAFHELATNAAKHGALSVPSGRVRLTWRSECSDEEDVRYHEVLWEEVGGPPIMQVPEHRGFGMRLLERALAAQVGGTIVLEFAATGIRCRIRIPGRSPLPPADLSP